MRAVDEEGPAPRRVDALEPPAPARRPQAARDRRIVQGGHRARGRDRERNVPELVGAGERGEPRPVRRRRNLHETGADAPGFGVEDGSRAVLRPFRADESRLAPSEDAGLLARDVLERGAEDVEMVRRDVRDDRDHGLEDVRRVEAPADPDLHDGHADTGAAEELERRDRHRLEVRRRAVAGRRYGRDEGERGIERRERDVAIQEAHALRDGHEVRRGVEPARHAGGREDRGDRRGRRALPVRACR